MTAKTICLKDYQPSAFQIDQVNVEFHLDSERTRVVSQLTIKRNIENTPDLVLMGEQLSLISVRLNHAEPSFVVDDSSLKILNVPDAFLLEIITEIHPKNNTELTGLYQSNGIFCTQCEAEYFRKITYYLDRPDVMSFFTVKIIADKSLYPVLLSNGNLVDVGDIDDEKHYAVWDDPFKKPSYLFALVAGDLASISDHFITMSGRRISLHIYSEKQNIDRCHFAMECLKKSMRWDEESYGREYDLDIFNIVAVNDFIFGAMENKSLNIFNAKYVLADEQTATDQDYADIDTVIAHEYFHNWSGNRVTCRDWFQLSLKEGFTIFREQSYDETYHSSVVHRIRKVQDLRNAQFAEDAGPMAHPVRPQRYIAIDNFYTRTVYNKGGEVVRMLKTILGKDLYHRACERYFEKFDGQAVTTDDFIDVMEEISERDLSQFRLWYSQAGTPMIHAKGVHDLVNKTYTLTLEQHIPPTADQKEKAPMLIPISVALLTHQGHGAVIEEKHEGVLLLQDASQHFTFHGIEHSVVPSLNRHFSSPVKLDFPYTEHELLFLFQHDTDAFNRWDAGQQLMSDIILKDKPREHFIEVVGRILKHPMTDFSLQTELLSLPSEKYLHQNVDIIDPQKIFASRLTFAEDLAKAHESLWLNLYHALAGASSAYSPEAMGRRRLRSLCLSYLIFLNKEEYNELAYQQFKAASTMTESIAALSALSHTDSLQRIEALAHFQDRWQGESLVMNKWFAVQAQSRLASTLETVKQLMQQPFFAIKNPNSVYALIGGFCSDNIGQFHQLSGLGYEFCKDVVLLLDSFNPMVAARMVEPLLAWKRFESPHAELMKKALEKILSVSSISKNIYEPVSKALIDTM